MTEPFRQLVFCPQDPQWISTGREKQIDLETVLRSVGLIASQVDVSSEGRFAIGEQFLQHINFMGCAPAVEFTPGQDKKLNDTQYWHQFTFVLIPPERNQPACYIDETMAKPKCPACNKRTALSSGQNYFDDSKSRFSCPHCQHSSDLCELDWREFGGCARTMVSIVNVYPKEAIPTESLLLQLEKLTQIDWRYFYYYGHLVSDKA